MRRAEQSAQSKGLEAVMQTRKSETVSIACVTSAKQLTVGITLQTRRSSSFLSVQGQLFIRAHNEPPSCHRDAHRYSRSHDAVIRVYDGADNVTETHPSAQFLAHAHARIGSANPESLSPRACARAWNGAASLAMQVILQIPPSRSSNLK